MPRDVYYTLIEHFKKLGKEPPKCPICGEQKWSVQTLIAPELVEERPLLGLAQTLKPLDQRASHLQPIGQRGPLVPMLCQVCFFVYHFAWIPIVQGSGGDGE
jgi:hypothetical protein